MSKGNFKIKALKTYKNWIEKGKTYEIKNGQIIWEDGFKNDNIEDFDSFIHTYKKIKEYIKEVKDIDKEEIIIYRKENEVIAIKKENGQVIKSASVKCHPNDTFDFEIGSKLAFNKLLEKQEPYLKLVNYNSKDYGKVGKPTIYKDESGKPLFVGDKVLTISNRTGDYSEAFVVSNDKDFIMGIHCNCNEETGTISNWRVVKIQDFSKTQDGDEIEGIKCVIS